MIPHVNLSSFAGGGKTTVSELLLERFQVVMIPKYTTRPQRTTEDIPEYVYVSEEEFRSREAAGDFIAVEALKNNGHTYYYGIPVPRLWPAVPLGTELILSAFAEQARLVQEFVPDIFLVFIDVADRELLKERLRQRCEADGSNFEKKWAQNEHYFQIHIEGQYDHIVYNDGSPDETLQQIMNLIHPI